MEGPSLVILREELQQFQSKKVLKVTGNTKQPKELLKGLTLRKIDTWAKVLFMTFSSGLVIKVHFMLFGSYRINDPKADRIPRLELKFKNGSLYFYACSILFHANEYLDAVDREVDVMAPEWNEDHVLELMEKKRNAYLCDLFLDQSIFAGSGNIVKNEVLFNIRRDPLTKLSKIDRKDWPKLAHAVKEYCQHFYEWKKKFELRKHWQVYKKFKCPVCEEKLMRQKVGKGERMSFYCPSCQKLNARKARLDVHDVLPIKGVIEREERLDH